MNNFYPTNAGQQQPQFYQMPANFINPQQGAATPPQANCLKGRPVSSLDEVRAAQVDFDGSIAYFPDMANKRIYTKQIQMDGSSCLRMFEEKPIPVPQSAQYVTKEEFEQVLAELKAAIVDRGSSTQPQVPQAAAPIF